MSRYYYDLHIHSCLSPCGDDDMTPNNIAGMAALKGLQMIALTDHNTTANCKAFFTACKRQGIIPIAGMELTTAEEIHLVCLFPTLEEAEAFESVFREYRMKIPNRPEIFGNQLICGDDDEVTGTEELLLPPASLLSLDEATALATKHGAFCYPAHIDRPSNGIIEILGDLPESPAFTALEFSPNADIEAMMQKYPSLHGKTVITSSDAHYLWNISEADHFFELDDTPYSSATVRARLFDLLRRNV